MNTFDDALNLSFEHGFESPSETEEREAAQAGKPLLTDREVVEQLDDEAEELAELQAYMREQGNPWAW